MLLSVLSALARLDIDPWQEAAELARLPREAAVRRLASLIANLPEDGAASQRDPKTIAARLIALLPRTAGFEIPSHAAPRENVDARASLRPPFLYLMIFFLAVMLGVRLFTADGKLPGPVAGTSTQAIGTSSPKNASGNHGP